MGNSSYKEVSPGVTETYTVLYMTSPYYDGHFNNISTLCGSYDSAEKAQYEHRRAGHHVIMLNYKGELMKGSMTSGKTMRILMTEWARMDTGTK